MNRIIRFVKSWRDVILTSSTRTRIARGAFWGSAGTIVTRSFTVILSFVLARILGKDGFGEYGMINNTIATVTGFAGLGLGSTVTRYVANLRSRETEKVGKILGLSSIISWVSALIYIVLLILLAPWIADKVISAPHLSPLLQISSITLGLGVINSVQTSILAGLESFKLSSILNSILSILNSSLVVILAYTIGIKGAIIALAINSGIVVLVFFIASRKELVKSNIIITFRDLQTEWEVITKYSLPAFLGTITVGPVIWASNAFLANQPDGYGELGIYNAAMQWHTLIRFIPSLLSIAVLPVMTDIHGSGNRIGSNNIMLKMMKITAIIVIPIAVIISLFSPLIIKGYGSSFEGGQPVIVILVFSAVFSTISAQLGTYLAAIGKMWIGFAINTAWGLVYIVFSYYLVSLGAIGLAYSSLFAYALHFIWSIIIALMFRKKIHRVITRS